MQAFLDVQEPGSRRIEVITPTAFFPLDCDRVPQEIAEAVVAAHLQRGGGFDVPWPLPTALSGEGLGARDFTWSGLLIDM